MPEMPASTRRLLAFIDASPTPYHAVASAVDLLRTHGFTEIDERERWRVGPGSRHYVVRTGSSVLAFVSGAQPPAEAGFLLAGAHTDSPNLRLKPRPAYQKDGFWQVGVEVYGGVLLHTWLDRDLSLAGRVMVEGSDVPRLLRVDRPICRVPSLAIHLDREVNERGLQLNKQQHLPPVFGLGGEDSGWFERFLGAELQVDPAQLREFDLMLYDTAPACVSGVEGDVLHAPRLDNLASCHAALEALCAAAGGAHAPTLGAVLYDHEEVGSQSPEGAGSNLLESVLQRLVHVTGGGTEDVHRAMARSLFVSADMAHGVHPNWSDKHEPRHMPRLGGGPVLKHNQNLRYATNAVTAERFARAARAAEVPLQRFVIRTDLPCGSTIGPITATRLGIPTVDVGNPMLSMHSIREMASAHDHDAMIRVLTALFAGR